MVLANRLIALTHNLDSKPFIAHKVHGRWELKKGEIIVVT